MSRRYESDTVVYLLHSLTGRRQSWLSARGGAACAQRSEPARTLNDGARDASQNSVAPRLASSARGDEDERLSRVRPQLGSAALRAVPPLLVNGLLPLGLLSPEAAMALRGRSRAHARRSRVLLRVRTRGISPSLTRKRWLLRRLRSENAVGAFAQGVPKALVQV